MITTVIILLFLSIIFFSYVCNVSFHRREKSSRVTECFALIWITLVFAEAWVLVNSELLCDKPLECSFLGQRDQMFFTYISYAFIIYFVLFCWTEFASHIQAKKMELKHKYC